MDEYNEALNKAANNFFRKHEWDQEYSTWSDFLAWFPKSFIGQIICWHPNINY